MSSPPSKPKIREIIVVEGKDDVAAVKQAVDAECLITHGHGFGEELLDQLEEIHRRRGIIVMTDPDYAGKKIRARILERIPDAGVASLDRLSASKGGDIGVENAAPEKILEALVQARATQEEAPEEFSREDLRAHGLDGAPGAKERRICLCQVLHIPYSNAKSLLPRLNGFGISRQEFEAAMVQVRAMTPDPAADMTRQEGKR